MVRLEQTTTRRPGPRGSARDRLLQAALERFASEGLVAVSLDDVRDHAGVSVGALYHHFADKAALHEALYLQLTVGFQTEFLADLHSHPSAEAGVKAGVAFYLAWVSRNRRGARLLLGQRPPSPRLAELNRHFLGQVRAWWDTHAHYGTVRRLPLDVIHSLWFGPAHEYTRQWLDDNRKRLPSAATALLAEAAWESLKEPT